MKQLKEIYLYYLGSIPSENSGTEEDVLKIINIAQAKFAHLRPIWRSRQLRKHIFGTNVSVFFSMNVKLERRRIRGRPLTDL